MGKTCRWFSSTKNRLVRRWIATTKPTTLALIPKESGIIQGDLIVKHWAANQGWDLNKDGQIQFVLLKGEPGHAIREARTTYVIKELNDKGIKTEQLQVSRYRYVGYRSGER